MTLWTGESMRQIAARKAWATRRDRYGASGMAPETCARMSAAARQRVLTKGNQHSKKPKCRHGHSLTDAYQYVRHGRVQRQCRLCVQLCSIRRRTARRQRVHLAALRQAMILAHPDHGGTARKFREAYRAYQQAKAAA